MIIGDLTLREIEKLYLQAGLHELVVFPFYSVSPHSRSSYLSGLITGFITDVPGFSGKSAQLDHYIVLPYTHDKIRVMQEMPREIADKLRARGVERIFLCIEQGHPKRDGLGAWARRVGYTKAWEADGRDWYINDLKEKGLGQEFAETDQASGAPAAPSAPAARS